MTPREFVFMWMRDHPEGADVCSQAFHDAFHALFGGTRAVKFWGAMPVHKAMRLLRQMHREDVLERCRIKLGDGLVGFPSWVYNYRIKPLLPSVKHADCDCSACLPPTY